MVGRQTLPYRITEELLVTRDLARIHAGDELDPATRWRAGAFTAHEGQLDGWAKQLFQCPDVFGEGLAASFGDAIQGL